MLTCVNKFSINYKKKANTSNDISSFQKKNRCNVKDVHKHIRDCIFIHKNFSFFLYYHPLLILLLSKNINFFCNFKNGIHNYILYKIKNHSILTYMRT